MDIEIIEFIRSSFSPEEATTYEKAFELFSKFNVENYILPFNEIYMLVDDFDLTYIQQQFHDQLNEMLHDVLNEHGIFVNDETTFNTINGILEGILAIETFEDKSQIQSILDSENTDEEKFADIFTLVSDLDSDTILISLERVNPGLFRTIRKMVDIDVQATEIISNNDVVIIKEKAEWVKRLFSLSTVEFKECKTSILYPKLEEGLRFNLAFDFYYNMLWDSIASLNNYDIARELVGMTIISNDKAEKAVEVIREYLGKYFYDIDQIGRIMDLATRQFLVSKQDNGIIKV